MRGRRSESRHDVLRPKQPAPGPRGSPFRQTSRRRESLAAYQSVAQEAACDYCSGQDYRKQRRAVARLLYFIEGQKRARGYAAGPSGVKLQIGYAECPMWPFGIAAKVGEAIGTVIGTPIAGAMGIYVRYRQHSQIRTECE